MEGRILVIGATGLLGQPIARALQQGGFTVRTMGRNRERLEGLFDEPFEIAVGDAADATSVATALEGCVGVHISVTDGPDEAKTVANVVAAAKEQGVERVSYVSGTSVREENTWYPMVRYKYDAEQAIKAGGVGYTIFKPTWFMDMVGNFIKTDVAVCFGKGRTRLRFLAVDDFVAMVARAFALDEANHHSFRVLGPEPLSVLEAIDRYRAALHPHIDKVTRLPYWLASVIAFLRGNERMKWAVGFMRYFEKAGEGEPTPETERLLGTASTTFEQWLASKQSERS